MFLVLSFFKTCVASVSGPLCQLSPRGHSIKNLTGNSRFIEVVKQQSTQVPKTKRSAEGAERTMTKGIQRGPTKDSPKMNETYQL